MRLLEGAIRDYAWGSHTAIANLQGRPAPTAGPEAELWLGAHPSAPSLLWGAGAASGAGGPGAGGVDRAARPLTDVIAADPAGILGAGTVQRFGARLPFLLKVLAAAQPLSLQAHPDLEQARAGYAAEQAAGTEPSQRNYVDPWHKPELLVALEPFEALCGFRDPHASADLLAVLDVAALKPVVEALRAADPAIALRESVQGLLTLPAERRTPLVTEVATAAASRVGEHPSYALAIDLARRYPGDVGVLVAMLLNWVRLQPGEAVWMPAGNLHAYLDGLGVEIMAASDNVLRGGLTPKHVDVAELLRIVRFEVLPDPVIRPTPVAPGIVTWPVPIADFALHRALISRSASGPASGGPAAGGAAIGPAGGAAAVRFPGSGPRIVLCARGSVHVDDGEQAVSLHGGQAAFATASAGPVTVVGVAGAAGFAEVYQASVGGRA